MMMVVMAGSCRIRSMTASLNASHGNARTAVLDTPSSGAQPPDPANTPSLPATTAAPDTAGAIAYACESPHSMNVGAGSALAPILQSTSVDTCFGEKLEQRCLNVSSTSNAPAAAMATSFGTRDGNPSRRS